VFVNSMSDLFHEQVPFEFVAKVWNTMFNCGAVDSGPQHQFQLLTKRPKRLLEFAGWMDEVQQRRIDYRNVWLGVSAENQRWADERLPILARVPAKVRFVSCEPLLGPLDLKPYFFKCSGCGEKPCACKRLAIQWVIAGGESGSGVRPMHPDWVRSIRDQCQAAAVPFFFKQWGAWLPSSQAPMAIISRNNRAFGRVDGETVYKVGKKAAGALLDGREWREMPDAK
jgi:protein gp37